MSYVLIAENHDEEEQIDPIIRHIFEQHMKPMRNMLEYNSIMLWNRYGQFVVGSGCEQIQPEIITLGDLTKKYNQKGERRFVCEEMRDKEQKLTVTLLQAYEYTLGHIGIMSHIKQDCSIIEIFLTQLAASIEEKAIWLIPETRRRTLFHYFQNYQFTNREKEIAYYWLNNYTVYQISKMTAVSEGTVRNNIKRIYKKLAVNEKGMFMEMFLHMIPNGMFTGEDFHIKMVSEKGGIEYGQKNDSGSNHQQSKTGKK